MVSIVKEDECSYWNIRKYLKNLCKLHKVLEVGSIGKSTLGKDIYFAKLGVRR